MIEVVCLTALSIIGLNRVVDGLLYTFTGRDLSVRFDILNFTKKQKWLKPVIFCTLCMSSLWGSTFITIYLIDWLPLVVIASIFAVAGLIDILERIGE
jgi:hypothetical protein